MLEDFDGSWEGLGWEGAGRAFDHTELGGLWKEFGGHQRVPRASEVAGRASEGAGS